MGMKKKWSKMSVVMDGLKGLGLKEITNKYGINDNQYYKWREEAFNRMKQAFEYRRRKESRGNNFETERDRLLKVIGEQKKFQTSGNK